MLPLAADDEVRLSAQVVIGDIERHGVVRSVSGEDNETILGIQFTNLGDDAKLALYGYVMSICTNSAVTACYEITQDRA